MSKEKKKRPEARPGYESEVRTGEKEIGKTEIDRITHEPGFQYFEMPTVGVNFHIFHKVGDEITGTIIGNRIKNVRRTGSYPVRLEDGKVVEIFATLHLRKLKRCVGRKVRIKYIGRKHRHEGHYEKVFRVYIIEREGEILI